MGANFTPTFGPMVPLKPFRFWCQKVLPLVYDDSLSYYELLCKVVDYLNKTMEDVETLSDDVNAMLSAFNSLQAYVNDYFDNLDLTAEVQTVLDRMAENGSLSALLAPLVDEKIGAVVADQIGDTVAQQIYDVVASQINDVVATYIPDAVAAEAPAIITGWLTENVEPVGSTVLLDSTLTIQNAAADAKAAGDRLTEDEAELYRTHQAMNFQQKFNIPFVVGTEGSYLNSSGAVVSGGTYFNVTDYIDVSMYKYIMYKQICIGAATTTVNDLCFYTDAKSKTSNGNKVSDVGNEYGYMTNMNFILKPPRAKYVRFTIFADTETYGNFELIGITAESEYYFDVITDIYSKRKLADTSTGNYTISRGRYGITDGHLYSTDDTAARTAQLEWTGPTLVSFETDTDLYIWLICRWLYINDEWVYSNIVGATPGTNPFILDKHPDYPTRYVFNFKHSSDSSQNVTSAQRTLISQGLKTYTQRDNIVLDASLTVEGDAADAKAVGDRFTELAGYVEETGGEIYDRIIDIEEDLEFNAPLFPNITHGKYSGAVNSTISSNTDASWCRCYFNAKQGYEYTITARQASYSGAPTTQGYVFECNAAGKILVEHMYATDEDDKIISTNFVPLENTARIYVNSYIGTAPDIVGSYNDITVEYKCDVQSTIDEIRNDTNFLMINNYKYRYFTNASMFTEWAVCGASRDAGEIHWYDSQNQEHTASYRNLSWGAINARNHGTTCANYAFSGAKAETWITNTGSYAMTQMLADPAKQLYVMSFGYNEKNSIGDFGSTANTHDTIEEYTAEDLTKMYGAYPYIYLKIKEHAPNALVIALFRYYTTSTDADKLRAWNCINYVANRFHFPVINWADSPEHNLISYSVQGSSAHPVAQGYALMANCWDELLGKCMYENWDYFKDFHG